MAAGLLVLLSGLVVKNRTSPSEKADWPHVVQCSLHIRTECHASVSQHEASRGTKLKLHAFLTFLTSVVAGLTLKSPSLRHRPNLYTTKFTNMAAALTTEFRAIATPPRSACILSRLEAGRGSAVRTWAAGCMTASSTNRDEQDRTKRHRSCDCERIACLTALCQTHRTRSSHWTN